MNTNTKLFFDLDDTLARFNFGSKTPLESMYKEGYFLNLKPHVLAHEANHMAEKYPENIFVVSACITKISMDEKKAWVEKWLPNIKAENVFLVNVGDNKAEYIVARTQKDIDRNCILIDDYSKNIYDWGFLGGTAVKCINNFNDKKGVFYKYKFRTVKQFHRVLGDITADSNF